jgi:hypothetical protein
MELPLGISSHKVTGGNWDNQANAGVFNLNLNNARTITNQNVGFRAVLLRLSISITH